eukprot:3793142-Rhodomonas_salina.2
MASHWALVSPRPPRPERDHSPQEKGQGGGDLASEAEGHELWDREELSSRAEGMPEVDPDQRPVLV